MTAIHWDWFKFDEMSVHGLYDSLRLRSKVFVVEQDCIFLDIDNFDQGAFHLLGRVQSDLKAYLRCIPPEIFGSGFSSLGRIVCEPTYRGNGIGRMLVEEGIAFARKQWPENSIKIGAQERLLKFYESLGFYSVSEPYDEDGIQHVDMVLDKA